NRIGRHVDEQLEPLPRHQKADDAGKRRRTIAVACKASGDADREEQTEMREDRIARRADKGDVEQIGLTEAQQQRRDGQHRNRQHQRAAERLNGFDCLAHQLSSSTNARASARISVAEPSVSALAASDWQAARSRRRTSAFASGTKTGMVESSVT